MLLLIRSICDRFLLPPSGENYKLRTFSRIHLKIKELFKLMWYAIIKVINFRKNLHNGIIQL